MDSPLFLSSVSFVVGWLARTLTLEDKPCVCNCNCGCQCVAAGGSSGWVLFLLLVVLIIGGGGLIYWHNHRAEPVVSGGKGRKGVVSTGRVLTITA